MASTVVVTYELQPERLDEHVALIQDVFRYLYEAAPAGVHYAALRAAEVLAPDLCIGWDVDSGFDLGLDNFGGGLVALIFTPAASTSLRYALV